MDEEQYVTRWNGEYFGWIQDDELYTDRGVQVGRTEQTEICGRDGKYLGELREHRLITHTSKKGAKATIGFLPPRIPTLPPRVRPMNDSPLDLPAGYEDFPHQGKF